MKPTTLALPALATAVLATALRNLALPPRVTPGQVALITGGSRGLGLALAHRFGRAGCKLVLSARSADELELARDGLLRSQSVANEDDIQLVACDLTDREQIPGLIASALNTFGALDILVNNAGIIEVGPIEAMTADMFEQTMRVNFLAAMQTTWAALPRLLAQNPAPGWSKRAALINISSIGGKIPVPHMLPYTASKFAMTGFSEGLYAELKGKGIHVRTVCPGLLRTGGEDHAHFHGNVEAEEAWFKFLAKTPGISTTVEHASSKIYSALTQSRTEVTITPQAYLGSRYAGLFPGGLQWLNRLTNDYVLPKP